MKTYYEANKEKIAAKDKAYYEANKEKIAAKDKAYYEANKEKIAAKDKAYYEANKEKIAAKRKAYYEANKDKLAAKHREYYEANKEELAAKMKVYSEANKDKIAARKKEYSARPEVKVRRREWVNKRNAESPARRIHDSVSVQIRDALGKGGKNGRRTFEILGYTCRDLINHLESRWESWMNWGNYGHAHINGCTSWQIDHIIPVSYFKISSTEDQSFKDCWALSNLQPLEAIENIRKGNKQSFLSNEGLQRRIL
jgi:hypothetical protein